MTKFSVHIILIFSLFFQVLITHAQNNILDYFYANETEGKVFLQWSISSGETCNGIKITRSADGRVFSVIGEISGVCGEADVPVPYSFLDESPIENAISYYRLELGISNFSEVVSIQIIDKNKDGYQVRPNPIIHTGTIYFDNPNAESWTFSLFKLSGALVQKTKTYSDYIIIKPKERISGTMFFVLHSSEKTISGKILML